MTPTIMVLDLLRFVSGGGRAAMVEVVEMEMVAHDALSKVLNS